MTHDTQSRLAARYPMTPEDWQRRDAEARAERRRANYARYKARRGLPAPVTMQEYNRIRRARENPILDAIRRYLRSRKLEVTPVSLIAEHLNGLGFTTQRGTPWTANSLGAFMKRHKVEWNRDPRGGWTNGRTEWRTREGG